MAMRRPRWPWTRAATKVADTIDEALAEGLATVDKRSKRSYRRLRRFVDREIESLNTDLNTLAGRLDELTPLPRVPVELDLQEKGRMQMAWPNVRCSYCGTAHGGICPRVRRVEFMTNGAVSRVWFWPDGKWELPADALTVEDVFGSPVAMPREEQQQ